jgi:hypothetical protein
LVVGVTNCPGAAIAEIIPSESPAEVEQRLRGRLEAALAIHNPFERDDALAELAVGAAKAGHGGIVRTAIREIGNPFTQNDTASRCARLLANAGQSGIAVDVANMIANPFERDATLKHLARGG